MALSKAALKRIIGAVPEPEDDDIGKWVVGVIRSIETEVRKEYIELIQQFVEALRGDRIDIEDWPADSRIALDALRAGLEGKS